MSFSGIGLKKLAAVMLLGLPAVVFSAECSGMFENLPRHSAMVTGVDFSALNAHKDGAEIFRVFRETGGGAAGFIDRVLFACDGKGERCVSLFSLKDAVVEEKLLKRIYPRLEVVPPDISRGHTLYLIRGMRYGGRAVFLSPVDRKTAMIYAKYPDPLCPAVEERGIAPALENILPRRKDVFVFGAGFPRMQEYPLSTVSRFDFALESDVDAKLRFHGQICFRNSLEALLAEKFMPGALMLLLEMRFNVPPEETAGAWNALKFQRQNNVLRFSGTDLPPVINVLGKVLKNSMEPYEDMMK